ncbi:AAA family ATPase, partial [Parabacteroides sp. OttesenSCG-928-N08]|nr:AAA family ATPase [Parabacteroides sp. OttesenSCG-928-N08]
MDFNTQSNLALKYIQQTGCHLFLTGKAGTGKTTFLRQLKEISPKRMIVVAPTGVAAINAGGVTIHSFFQLPFGPYLPTETTGQQQKSPVSYNQFRREKLNIIRSIDLLVIDEISMVRADLLDAVSDTMQRIRHSNKPFGGVQLLLIGDMQQLAPVAKEEEWNLLKPFYASPYFFDSNALKASSYISIELTHV